MRPSFHPRLVNGPFEDPALFIPFFLEKRALLFDMGDLHSLAPKEILKITHAFVTHTHMDHFVGFDTLLRVFLGRTKALHLFGPAGFVRNVEGRLAGYTWNLVKNYDNRFTLKVTEVHPDHTLTQVYECNEAFSSSKLPDRASFNATLLKEPSFSVQAIHLDHKIPCLAFRVEESFHVNIVKEGLEKLGIPVGPWLKQFKEALYEGHDPEESFCIELKNGDRDKKLTFRLGDLTNQIARTSAGQKIVYVVDVTFSPENVEKIVGFARNADQLFIEAAFTDAHEGVALTKCHLTARQAGIIARKAGVKYFTVFHHSPRYAANAHILREEANQAFAGISDND